MDTTAFCIVALVISGVCLIASIGLGICRHYLSLKSQALNSKFTVLTPLRIAMIGFFFALVALFYPANYIDYFAGESGALRVIKSLLLSAQNAVQVFFVNINFEPVKALADGERVSKAVGAIYSIYAAILYVLAPALTASFILSFFKETGAKLRYALSLCRDIYILSELNEKSITLAKDIKANKGRKLIVFASVNKKNRDSALLFKAKSLGAICFKSDITSLGLKRASKNIRRKLYFIGENEDENLKKALDIVRYCQNKGNLDSEKTELYVFAASTKSEILLSSADIGKMKVRRVNDNKNLVWHTLRENSIFDDARDGELNIVIVGCGSYGTELVKAICWLAQMPGYKLSLHIFDKENPKEKFKFIAPELIEKNENSEKGESFYSIKFYDADVAGTEFLEKVKGIKNLTSVFVTLGSDEMNIDTAIRLRVELLRAGYTDGCPSIYPVVYSSIRSAIAKNGDRLALKIKDGDGSYNLKFIGSIDSCYSLKNIEQAELEKKAEVYHLSWVDKNDLNKVKENIEKFNKYEYYRSSSMAQAIYNEYLVRRIKLLNGGSPFTKEDKVKYDEYEHRRWNAYMRAEGYKYGEKRDDFAKLHPDLVPFDKLSLSEQYKDEVRKIAQQLEAND